MPLAAALLMLAAAAPPAKIELLPVTSKHLAFEQGWHLVHAVRWRDRLGEHTLLLDESGAYAPEDPDNEMEDAKDASVFAYEYLEAGGKTTRVWKLEDHQRGCAFDLWAAFVPGSVTITDLDNDGEAEVTFQYTLQCTSDVSPATRKLILREGKDKYAIRGTDRNRAYMDLLKREPDPAFGKAPPAFLEHALEQWEAFVDVGAGQF